VKLIKGKRLEPGKGGYFGGEELGESFNQHVGLDDHAAEPSEYLSNIT